MPSQLSNICAHTEYFGEGFQIVLEESMASNFVDLCSGSTSTMKPSYVPKSISSLLKDLEDISNIDNKLESLNFHLHQYEVELAGVEGVKDLFPRCMLLLLDGQPILFLFFLFFPVTILMIVFDETSCLMGEYE
ncbi:putative DNA binding protein [Tripterygium wilfordii]|uniref:Putative DNA binding protein n=1 Tax=Tripterygium wilfordii TaxID=458696 RepID=A0A7J7DRC3_TRIWF|nr:putative DNA binding protein [Tripterygium wilfordii]